MRARTYPYHATSALWLWILVSVAFIVNPELELVQSRVEENQQLYNRNVSCLRDCILSFVICIDIFNISSGTWYIELLY